MIVLLHGFASAGEGQKAQMLRAAFPEEPVWAPTLPVSPLDALKLITKKVDDHLEPKGSVSRCARLADEKDDDQEMIGGRGQKVVRQGVSFVGTSFGGFYAAWLGLRYGAPALLINPVMKPSQHLRKYLGTRTNLKTGEPFEWKEVYHEELFQLETDMMAKMSSARFRVILGSRDTQVLPQSVRHFFSAQRLFDFKIQEYDDEHRFLRSLPQVLNDPQIQLFLQMR